MTTILGYQIDKRLHESPNSLVYRGYQKESNNDTIILKTLKQAYPSPERIAWFKREYEITRKLDLPGVVKAYSLESDQHQWVMVLEDFGGESVEKLLQGREFSVAEFLTLAIQIVDILGQIHQQHIMHKDINPANLVLNPSTGQIKLIDFGISTVLSRENPTLRNPNVLEGTLAYISPEQTGRMNRAIDYRTDFYSLGVTFYQLLSDQLPFPASDALELVHSHIAKHPVPLHILQPNIPPVISQIVLKLMSKNAEDRYQSAYGLKADLEKCLKQWQAEKQIDFFPLGQYDISDRFQIPQKLYGRKREIETLLLAFERASSSFPASPTASNGQGVEVMLVSGYAGIGKSALVHEIYKPITHQRGYFIAGKFEQFQRNIPYASLIQAFRSLIQQLLTENEAQIASWKEKIVDTLGANGQVMIEVISELELIIGPQPEVPELAPLKAQNRFNLVFQNFINLFTQPEHPLVIFLDDLQWADAASLKLLQLLVTTPDSHYLFVIGTYRDNEVKATHPLMLTLAELEKDGVKLNQITLAPLKLAHISQLVADTLNCSPEEAQPLAELVLAKTGGNPFFMNEFLKSLYAEGLLIFDFEKGAWQWTLEKIQARGITDNVVELMTNEIQKLSLQTQYILKLAACIGNQFDLQTLSIVGERSVAETATNLVEVVTQGLIFPLGEQHKLVEQGIFDLAETLVIEYRFTHDRIQQAGYSLILEEQKQAIHLQVGQLLLQNTPSEQREQKIFDIVNPLNFGLALIKHEAERIELAELNLMAGRKAKNSTAYQPALAYLKNGLKLLNSIENSWQTYYDLTLAMHVEFVEVVYLNTDFETMEQLVEVVLQQAKTLIDKVSVYEVLIQAYLSQNKLSEALQTGLQVLTLLDIEFPQQPSQEDLGVALAETKSILAGRNFEELIDLPLMTDPDKLAAMRILVSINTLALFIVPKLAPLIAFKLVDLSIKYGYTPESAFAYAGYGMMVSGFMGDIETGYQAGKLGLILLDRLDAKKYKAMVLTGFNGLVRHWKEHIREALPSLLEGYQSALETGDLQYVAFGARMYCSRAYLVGMELHDLEMKIAQYNEVMVRLKQITALNVNAILQQVVFNLLGRSEIPYHLSGEYYNEDKMLPLHYEANDRGALFALYFHKLVLGYLFQAYSLAYESAKIGEDYIDTAKGTPFGPVFYFFDSLVRLAMFTSNDIEAEKQANLLEKVTANQGKMKNWADHAPMNYGHKFYLVEAEKARVLGKDQDAREYYYQAITLAQKNEYPNEEALANELAGQFYLSQGQRALAHHYIYEAYYVYQRWGALAKLDNLTRRYPDVFIRDRMNGSDTSITVTSTPTSITKRRTVSSLDLSSVFRASQALSGEIVLDKLLTTLMKIAIENAGAQVGYLILNKQGQWVIEAEGSVDKDEIMVLQSIPIRSEVEKTDRDGAISVPMSVINYAARTKKNIVLTNAAYEGSFTEDPYIVANQPKSVLCAPLLNQGKLNGILYLENNLTPGTFTPDRLALLNLLSSQAAISIENAMLYTNIQSSEKKYRTLFEDSKDTIFVTTPSGQIIDVNPAGEELFGYIREEAIIMTTHDFYVNPEDRIKYLTTLEEQGSVKDFEVRLRKKSGVEIDCLITSTVRLADDGTILGHQGIVRDITARKQAEKERLQLSAIQRELTIAQDIQQSLLPPQKPDWSGPEVLCYNAPAREVGGDFYAYHALSSTTKDTGEKYGLAVGDVSGKGMPAALLMAVSLASLQAIVGQELTPADLLSHLDQAILPYTRTSRQNCALVYVEITLPYQDEAGVVRVANAGCIPPLIQRADGSVEWVEVGGLPLGAGVVDEFEYHTMTLPLAKEDIIVLVSDGVIEANNSDNEMLGFDRLEQIVVAGPNTNAQAMLAHLQAEITAFVGQAEPHDDLTIVVLQV